MKSTKPCTWKRVSILGLRVFFSPEVMILGLTYKDKSFGWNLPNTKPWRLARKMRGAFPSAHYVSFWDCDSARYYTGHEFFAWNDWHLRRLERQLDYLSDGTHFRQISLKSYLWTKLERMKMRMRGETCSY